jgi:hypothetical protein
MNPKPPLEACQRLAPDCAGFQQSHPDSDTLQRETRTGFRDCQDRANCRRSIPKNDPSSPRARATSRLHLVALPCRVAGCPSPRYVAPSGYVKSLCHEHEAERVRRAYARRLGHPARPYHFTSKGASL